MPIDAETVERMAVLARLELPPEERERTIRELQAILSYVEQLQALDVEGIEPTSQVTEGLPPALRPDEAHPSAVRDEALANAPDRDGDYFRVPQVV